MILIVFTLGRNTNKVAHVRNDVVHTISYEYVTNRGPTELVWTNSFTTFCQENRVSLHFCETLHEWQLHLYSEENYLMFKMRFL